MKRIIPITCCSFTAVMMLFTLLHDTNLAPDEVGHSLTIHTFIITFSIALLMAVMEKVEDIIDISSLYTDFLIRLTICFVTVYVEGLLFGWFDLSLRSLLLITPITILAFLCTWCFIFISNKEAADIINKNIKKRSKH